MSDYEMRKLRKEVKKLRRATESLVKVLRHQLS